MLHFQSMVMGEDDWKRQKALGHKVKENINWNFVKQLNKVNSQLQLRGKHDMEQTAALLRTTVTEMMEERKEHQRIDATWAESIVSRGLLTSKEYMDNDTTISSMTKALAETYSKISDKCVYLTETRCNELKIPAHFETTDIEEKNLHWVQLSDWARSTMTSRSRLAVHTDSQSHVHTKVDSVPTSSCCDEEQEGMTTKTTDSTHDTTEDTTSSKTGTQDKDPTVVPRRFAPTEIQTPRTFAHEILVTPSTESNGKKRRKRIKNDFRRHPIEFRDCGKGPLEAANPKPCSFGRVVVPLPYLCYCLPLEPPRYRHHSESHTTAISTLIVRDTIRVKVCGTTVPCWRFALWFSAYPTRRSAACGPPCRSCCCDMDGIVIGD